MRALAMAAIVGIFLTVGIGFAPVWAGTSQPPDRRDAQYAEAADELVLGSIDWPPYARAILPDEGRSSRIVRAAFAAVGIQVRFEYMPWSRMVALIRAQRLDGGLSFYESQERQEWCHFSPAYDVSPLALAERSYDPIRWERLEDLSSYLIGTVRDYVNTPDFDRLARDGVIRIETVNDDALNLRKLMATRIDAAVIDGHVFTHLMQAEPELRSRPGLLRLNGRLLQEKSLHICFQKTARGMALRDRFADGLRQIGSQPGMLPPSLTPEQAKTPQQRQTPQSPPQ